MPSPGGEGAELARRKGAMGSAGGLWPDEGLTDGRECAIIKDTKCGVIHAVASLGRDFVGGCKGFDGVLKPRSSQANGHERLKLDR